MEQTDDFSFFRTPARNSQGEELHAEQQMTAMNASRR